MSPLLWLSRSICLLFVLFSWPVVLACKVASLAYVILLMVFSFFAICVLEISFHGVLPSKLPSSYFELFSQSPSLSSCISGVSRLQVSCFRMCRLQVVFTECVAFQLDFFVVYHFHSSFLVSFIFCFSFSFITCMAYKVFSWPVLPSRCCPGICRRQVSRFLALDAFRQLYITCIALNF